MVSESIGPVCSAPLVLVPLFHVVPQAECYGWPLPAWTSKELGQVPVQPARGYSLTLRQHHSVGDSCLDDECLAVESCLTRVSEFKNPWGSLGLYRFCVLFVCVCKFIMAHYICRIAYQSCTRPYFKSAKSHLLPPRGFHIFHRISLRCQPSPHFMPFSGTFLGQIMGPKPGWGWSFADRIHSTLNYQYISWF